MEVTWQETVIAGMASQQQEVEVQQCSLCMTKGCPILPDSCLVLCLRDLVLERGTGPMVPMLAAITLEGLLFRLDMFPTLNAGGEGGHGIASSSQLETSVGCSSSSCRT